MAARLIILGLLVVCSVVTSTSQSGSAAKHDLVSVPPGTVITLRQDGLRISIEANGVVNVDGQTFDYDLSRIKPSISQEEVKGLVDEFQRINYFSLSDRYYDKADGCPRVRSACVMIVVITSFTLNGKSKSISRAPYECRDADGSPYPRELVMIEKKISEVVDLRKR